MDTRKKIVTTEEAIRLSETGAVTVSGYFDPVLASHASRLAGLKQEGASLLVLVDDPEDAILPVRARMELVAALAAVDYVAELKLGFEPQVTLQNEDRVRLQELIRHVHARQSTGA